MKKIQFEKASLLLIVLLIVTGWTLKVAFESYSFVSQSSIKIEGTSTIHDWTCTAEQVNGTLDSDSSNPGVFDVKAVEVVVPVSSIECDNGTMNRKTRDALKAGSHPNIRYKFSSGSVVSGTSANSFMLRTSGQLTIAGVTRSVTMNVNGTRLGDNKYRFTGQTSINMSDYRVDPPKALLGTIKTGDRVVVHLDVVASR